MKGDCVGYQDPRFPSGMALSHVAPPGRGETTHQFPLPPPLSLPHQEPLQGPSFPVLTFTARQARMKGVPHIRRAAAWASAPSLEAAPLLLPLWPVNLDHRLGDEFEQKSQRHNLPTQSPHPHENSALAVC